MRINYSNELKSLDKLIAQLPDNHQKKITLARYSHCQVVSKLCYETAHRYVVGYNEKRHCIMRSLSKKEKNQIKNIKEKDLFDLVLIMGLIHDIYKLDPKFGRDHAKPAALWFRSYCKKNNIKFKNEVKDIYKAIKYHSNKDKKMKNIFYKILCDADKASKAHQSAFDETYYKNIGFITKSQAITYNLEKIERYEGKTPFYIDMVAKINQGSKIL